ncbi:hypothetical protein [Ottowia thiooxydans]|uniref:hypothetical protein n=1 Tax=Ottowia thiooxydans TaxID=219182 RepID=UPI00041FA454|nr:hypothetical protein [Ottowia thiooxydans]
MIEPEGISAIGWKRPLITISACLELTGRWWVVAMCGLLLLTALLFSLQRAQAQVLREARLDIALQGLRERLETNLSLGFELAESNQAQALLEDLLSDDPSLLAAEVFDTNSLSLFNTDRGAIGDRVPPSWILASSTMTSTRGMEAHATWSVIGGESFTLGMPIRGPFGEISGHISITSPNPPTPTPWRLLGAVLIAMVCLTAACALFTVWLMRGLARQSDAVGMDLAATRLHAAEVRLANGLEYLTRNEDGIR